MHSDMNRELYVLVSSNFSDQFLIKVEVDWFIAPQTWVLDEGVINQQSKDT